MSQTLAPDRTATITVLSITGAGKSTLANRLLVAAGGDPNSPHFSTSDSMDSHTFDCSRACVNGVTIIDTPGLKDSHGTVQEKKNVNAILFVVNSQVMRIDDSSKAVVMLFVNSFGPTCVRNMGIVFTRSFFVRDKRRWFFWRDQAEREADARKAKETARNWARVIAEIPGVKHLTDLPSWQVDCNPDELRSRGVDNHTISMSNAHTDETLRHIIAWAQKLPEFDTSHAKAAEYLEWVQIREASDRADKAEKKAAGAVKRAAEAVKRVAVEVGVVFKFVHCGIVGIVKAMNWLLRRKK